jgi:hypothetical protein
MVPEIEAVVEVYREFYRPERYCGCTEEHPYPHNVDSEGRPAVCLAHEWERQKRLFQRLLVNSGLSLPIPSSVKWDERSDKYIEAAGKRIYENPATSPSKIIEAKIRDDGSVATNLAWYLSQQEWEEKSASRHHIVVYLDRTMVITSTFEGHEAKMRDAITHAPVLVWWNSRDNRNGHWIKNAIRSRPHGLAFVVR